MNRPEPARPRVAIVTNMPAPYRVPVYDRLPDLIGGEVDCIYTTEREPNREWRIDTTSRGATNHFLSARHITVGSKYIYFSVGLDALLDRLQPDVIITTGYSQPYVQAVWYAHRHRLPHMPFTDGTFDTETALTAVHRLVRRYVFARSVAFIGASLGSRRLYESYGLPRERFFQSHLCADMTRYTGPHPGFEARPVDLTVSGRMHPDKHPLFALDVACGVAQRLGRRVRIEFLGNGPLRAQLEARAATLHDQGVDVDFAGFLAQDQLPAAYRRGKVLLFPTATDAWGVVANEACAAGMPVVISPHAGAAGELVVDGRTGRVVPLSLPDWVAATADLLADPARWQRMSVEAQQTVQPYHYDHAARGLADAVRFALSTPGTTSKAIA
jgi:glycosyltransferase involved in cell wall biosynthesis